MCGSATAESGTRKHERGKGYITVRQGFGSQPRSSNVKGIGLPLVTVVFVTQAITDEVGVQEDASFP
jgi:hypothetical protein